MYKNKYIEGGINTYPPPNIDPREKDFDWILAYVIAAYKDSRGFMPFGTLNIGSIRMTELKMYSLGKQSVDKYKKMMSPGEPTDKSWRAIDWTPPAFLCKFREIAIAKILQKKFDIQCFAIDPVAVSEEDAFWNKMKVKILMREAAQQAGSPLANSPVLAAQPGEPQDMEQLQMMQDFGYKHAMAVEAENAINLVNYQNHIEEIEKAVTQSLYDYGIAAVTQCLDENGMVKERAIQMDYFGCSYFEKPDGSDMVHWFEIVPTYVADLAPYYTKEQLDDICKKALNKNGNPNTYIPVNGFFNQAWNRFKVMVLQIKFLSWNDTIYKEETDKRGNVRFGKSSYENKKFLSVDSGGSLRESEDNDGYNESIFDTEGKGQATPKYINSCKKVVYKASWIIDTEYMHNYGLQENQNRKFSSWWDTDLDIQIYAWNFYKMQFTGMTERLIPFEDKACQIWFNLQNLSNKLIPYLINLEMNAIEGSFPFGKSGEKGKPSEVIDFIFSNFVVPYRANDLQSRNPNFKPVSIEATGQLEAFAQLHEELEYTLLKMQQISGLNEFTDASTPNPKTLVPGIESAVQSTNNALYLISEAKKNILLRTADAIVQKVQIAVQLGKVEGYAKALGDSSVQFFQINPQLALHELGVFIEEAPTDEQKQALWQDLSIKESQGLLTVGDKYFIMRSKNLDQATQIIDYKIQKRKEEAHAQQMQLVEQQAQGNQQVAQATEQMKQQTIQVQLQADLIRIQTEMEWQYRIEAMKKQADFQGESVQAEARTIGHQIQAAAKVKASEIAAGANIHSKHIQGQYDLVATDKDNETSKEVAKMKPKTTSKT